MSDLFNFLQQHNNGLRSSALYAIITNNTNNNNNNDNPIPPEDKDDNNNDSHMINSNINNTPIAEQRQQHQQQQQEEPTNQGDEEEEEDEDSNDDNHQEVWDGEDVYNYLYNDDGTPRIHTPFLNPAFNNDVIYYEEEVQEDEEDDGLIVIGDNQHGGLEGEEEGREEGYYIEDGQSFYYLHAESGREDDIDEEEEEEDEQEYQEEEEEDEDGEYYTYNEEEEEDEEDEMEYDYDNQDNVNNDEDDEQEEEEEDDDEEKEGSDSDIGWLFSNGTVQGHPMVGRYGVVGWCIYNKLCTNKVYPVESGRRFLSQLLCYYMMLNEQPTSYSASQQLVHFIDCLPHAKLLKKFIQCKHTSKRDMVSIKITIDILENYYRTYDSPTFKTYQDIIVLMRLFYEKESINMSDVNSQLGVLLVQKQDFSSVINFKEKREDYQLMIDDLQSNIRNLCEFNDYNSYFM